jgi:hypothetical protein
MSRLGSRRRRTARGCRLESTRARPSIAFGEWSALGRLVEGLLRNEELRGPRSEGDVDRAVAGDRRRHGGMEVAVVGAVLGTTAFRGQTISLDVASRAGA